MVQNVYQVELIGSEQYVTTPATFENIEEEFSRLGIELDPKDWPRWKDGRRCKLSRLSKDDALMLKLRY